ncbi:hypothetical protein K445DRAFT_270717 [Daldinia sp. EC12]|nr:hypothetical protein K445DRAFT_270717 [Daldinia sp. EC12]
MRNVRPSKGGFMKTFLQRFMLEQVFFFEFGVRLSIHHLLPLISLLSVIFVVGILKFSILSFSQQSHEKYIRSRHSVFVRRDVEPGGLFDYRLLVTDNAIIRREGKEGGRRRSHGRYVCM